MHTVPQIMVSAGSFASYYWVALAELPPVMGEAEDVDFLVFMGGRPYECQRSGRIPLAGKKMDV
jgi:hypothetical protein